MGETDADRVRAELALARAVIDAQQRIQEVGHTPDEVMQIVAQTSQELTGATGAVVEIADGADLVYRAQSGEVAVDPGFRLPAVGSLSGLCVSSREPLLCLDTETDARVNREACRQIGVRSMVVVPLLDDVVCHGVLKVLSPQPASFDEATIATLATMARYIAVALRRAGEFASRDHAASHDALTGLPNRHLLLSRLQDALAGDGAPALFFLDLDAFKAVNDTRGHAAGDRLLCEVAVRLRAAVRDTDTVARIGGDEFVVLCPDLADRDLALLQRRIETAARGRGASATGVSVGAVRAAPGDRPEVVLARADGAMYAVKQRRAGRRLRQVTA